MSHEIQVAQIDQLVEDPNNARVHDASNVAAIGASLQKFGQVEPLVVRRSNGAVIGGNGRLACMRQMGWKTADVVVLDLDDGEANALSVALNRTAELARWDYQKLSAILRQFEQSGNLDDLAIGWQDYELEPLLQANWDPVKPIGDLADFEEGSGKPDVQTIKVTSEQLEMFKVAVERVHKEARSFDDGECLKVICMAFLEAYGATV